MEQPNHLVHGMRLDLEEAVWPPISFDEAEKILAQFEGVGALKAIKWHSPRPFSAACIIETDADSFLLKRHHHKLRSPVALQEEHRFIVHLREKNLPVPQIYSTREKASSLLSGGYTYELQQKLPGQDIYRDRPSWTPFLSPDHGFQAGVMLAKIHEASHDFDAPARGPHMLVAGLSILRSEVPMAALKTYLNQRPAVQTYLADKDWMAQMEQLLSIGSPDLAERLAQQPSIWTHNDWHPSNMLWVDGKITALFDFGLSTRTIAVHDLATAIERSCISWLDQSAEHDPQSAVNLMKGYKSHLNLHAAEMELIIDLLPLVHIDFALSEIDYFFGLLNDEGQADMAWFDYLIGHAHWFSSAAGQKFLSQLRYGLDLT